MKAIIVLPYKKRWASFREWHLDKKVAKVEVEKIGGKVIFLNCEENFSVNLTVIEEEILRLNEEGYKILVATEYVPNNRKTWDYFITESGAGSVPYDKVVASLKEEQEIDKIIDILNKHYPEMNKS